MGSMKNCLNNLALAGGSLCIAPLIAELLFVWYEKHFLKGELVIENKLVDLSALNYNESQVPLRKPANEFRILSLGDSFGYTIVKYRFSYHGVAASLLNQALEGVTVRIVNLGEPAISFYQYMKAYRYWGSLLEHDAVIFNIYLGNDLLDVAYRYVPDDAELNHVFGKHNVNLQTGQKRETDGTKTQVRIEKQVIKVPRKYPLRIMDYMYAYYYGLAGRLQDRHPYSANGSPYSLALYPLPEEKYYHTSYGTLDNYDPSKVRKLERGYRAAIEFARMVSSIRQEGKRVLIMLSPPEVEIRSDLRRKVGNKYNADLSGLDLALPEFLVSEAIQRVDRQIDVLEMSGTFRCAANDNQDLYYKTDTHWSVEGNRLVGEIVAKYVSARWLQRYLSRPLAGLQACVVQREDLLGDRIRPTEPRGRIVKTFLEPLIASTLADSRH